MIERLDGCTCIIHNYYDDKSGQSRSRRAFKVGYPIHAGSFIN